MTGFECIFMGRLLSTLKPKRISQWVEHPASKLKVFGSSRLHLVMLFAANGDDVISCRERVSADYAMHGHDLDKWLPQCTV